MNEMSETKTFFWILRVICVLSGSIGSTGLIMIFINYYLMDNLISDYYITLTSVMVGSIFTLYFTKIANDGSRQWKN